MDHEAVMEDARASAMENPEFVWKSRIVDAVNRKISGINYCHRQLGITDRTEIIKLDRSIRHLEHWIEDYLEEEFNGIVEDNMDPYTLRGLRRSDF